jgi:hypothetical protein
VVRRKYKLFKSPKQYNSIILKIKDFLFNNIIKTPSYFYFSTIKPWRYTTSIIIFGGKNTSPKMSKSSQGIIWENS